MDQIHLYSCTSILKLGYITHIRMHTGSDLYQSMSHLVAQSDHSLPEDNKTAVFEDVCAKFVLKLGAQDVFCPCRGLRQTSPHCSPICNQDCGRFTLIPYALRSMLTQIFSYAPRSEMSNWHGCKYNPFFAAPRQVVCSIHVMLVWVHTHQLLQYLGSL
jgi:hypothetical protein